MTVRRGGSEDLSLKTIACQLREKAETAFNMEDIEGLYDILIDQDGSGRIVLIIDDAEHLQPDAITYLCVLSSMAKASAPQILSGYFQCSRRLIARSIARKVALGLAWRW